MLRRRFIQSVLATVAVSAGEAADTPLGSLVRDIHRHPRRAGVPGLNPRWPERRCNWRSIIETSRTGGTPK